MAEKYGTVPKKFTKEWWEYFWMYYKLHVLGTLFVIIALTITIVQVVTRPKYDLTICFAGQSIMSEEIAGNVEDALNPLCDDVDGNGKKNMSFMQLCIDHKSDPEYAMSMMQKLNLMLTEEDVYLYIMDSDTAKSFVDPDPEYCSFVPIDTWLDSVPEDASTYDANGISYGIALTDCEVFKALAEKDNLNFSGRYMFLRYKPRKDQKNQVEGYNAAIKLAQTIVKG